MTPKQFWLAAAEWGSYMHDGDQGACMYGFDQNGMVQSEAHRSACIRWLDRHCRPVEATTERPDEYVSSKFTVDDLIEYLRTAKVEKRGARSNRNEKATGNSAQAGANTGEVENGLSRICV